MLKGGDRSLLILLNPLKDSISLTKTNRFLKLQEIGKNRQLCQFWHLI
ncbi:hypothetical protein COO91_09631 (plasmid) [Nostoc flagelliforme CCNUN1]|uniref:Uncharacterized protein n=1 Tax=Nostoc flagelliforme CCNUN1 TaxID=2038116 RepID=A0A2K8T724_9NOSO|nr:hypothetical protein COO91_09631 [Nostoc flagelliforme CCNUN1]